MRKPWQNNDRRNNTFRDVERGRDNYIKRPSHTLRSPVTANSNRNNWNEINERNMGNFREDRSHIINRNGRREWDKPRSPIIRRNGGDNRDKRNMFRSVEK